MPTNLKNQQELITFGIICHNAEKTVSRAIDSCLKQTWQNTEIIILDDFSQDQSRDILESYAQNLTLFYPFRPRPTFFALRHKTSMMLGSSHQSAQILTAKLCIRSRGFLDA
tara:strand:+ start:1145 stop:1480 length:336 start_codon:yes stop_codon:yes gene_type:complete